MQAEDIEPLGEGSRAHEHQPKNGKPKRATDIRLLPNVASEKEDNESKCEKKGYLWRQMKAEQAGDVGFD